MTTAPYHPVLMVASASEWLQARSAGWNSRDIIGINVLQLEGRRYKSLTMTWTAFEAVSGKPEILERLESNAVLMHAETKIDTIKAPPAPVVVTS